MEANGGLQYNYDVNIEDYKKLVDQMYDNFEKPEKKSTFVPYNEKTYKKTENDVKIIAHYLPQYHSFKENDEWWGKGFTEWNNVTKAFPHFVGQMQPKLPHDIGFYDLSQKEIDKKLEDTLQNLKELRDESALYSTSNLMRELQIIRNGYVKGE